ncbi:MAG: MucR family transcriptional regulator [Sphingomonadales bacterium RIFCSPLOWO2_12_FULL_63_15]|nr:MAG: MucR family transcriptional regulator [Sphingomonadales bacterium RIFCSPLOWO2_12_FULL_63_15]
MSTEAFAQETLITLTADIVSAHVSNNSVSVSDVAGLIKNVHSALSGLAEPKLQEAPKQEPAVSARASIKPDHLVCLEDGKKMKMLKRHLMTAYGMTPADYRAKWDLSADYPMVAPNYAAQRKELALKIGLGRKPKATLEQTGEPAAKAPSKRGRKPKVAEPELA